jgi:hypothetical protein
MKIEHYISQLLYRYQCVTVPGFGAFLTEIQSAQVQANSHSFYPPKKQLSFNSYLKNNDGLLANHIAQSEKMSYEVAVSIIENQVQSWKTRLQEMGSISLKNIGEIVLNSEKNLVFTPTEQTNYHTDSFGLTSYVSPAIKREVYKQEVELLEEKAPIAFTPEKRGNSFLKYAAIFVLGASTLGISGYFGNQYYQNKIAQKTLLVETKVQQKVNQKIQEATFFIANPIIEEVKNTVAVEKVKSYHIVAGVYNKAFFANQYYDELKKLGYNAQKLEANKYGLYTVLYGSYATNEEAVAALKMIHQEHNKQAWIMIQ